MSFPVKAVVFDWAGTMVDFGCMAPVEALIEVFAAEGVAITDAEARRDMGKAKHDHLPRSWPTRRSPRAGRPRRARLPTDADIERIYQQPRPGHDGRGRQGFDPDSGRGGNRCGACRAWASGSDPAPATPAR